jgi:hypothetical protein
MFFINKVDIDLPGSLDHPLNKKKENAVEGQAIDIIFDNLALFSLTVYLPLFAIRVDLR